MAISIISNNSTAESFNGGINGVAAKNLVYRVVFSGAWNVGDQFQFDVVTNAVSYTCGKGRVTGAVPVNCITLYNKVNFVSGTVWYFSDNGDATAWEQQAAGAGYIKLSNQFSMPENLTALTQYQGKMCVQSRRTSQIWSIDPDPNNYALFQTLANIGCFAPLGADALGDLDVVFPYDSGIRSLRSRDVTLNATPSDIGSAVDDFVSTQLLALSNAQLATCCATIEPSQNRYWLFVPNANGVGGVIYVLSYFPNNKIVAWSRYNTTYYAGNVLTQFTPSKFLIYNGQVYVLDANALFVYGGANNNTYDATQPVFQIPFYDEKRPGHAKYVHHVDVDVQGSWEVYVTPDWLGGTFSDVGAAGVATFDQGNVPISDKGSHFSIKLVGKDNGYSAVNSLVLYYELGEEVSSQ